MTKQLWIPGTEPSYSKSFENYLCGDYSGQKDRDRIEIFNCVSPPPAALLAIYFIMGNYDEGDGIPELVGYDCPFPDSNQVYACSPEHMRDLTKHIKENINSGDIAGQNPEIIVNSRGEIEKDIYVWVLDELETKISKDFFSEKFCSRGKESLDTFWEREKHHFGF